MKNLENCYVDRIIKKFSEACLPRLQLDSFYTDKNVIEKFKFKSITNRIVFSCVIYVSIRFCLCKRTAQKLKLLCHQ